MNITHSLSPDLSSYAPNDYRRFLPAHLQFLQGLCELAITTVSISLRQFYSSTLVTADLLSEDEFVTRLNIKFETSEDDAHQTLKRVLFLIRSIHHSNAFISTYGSNFQYVLPWNKIEEIYAYTEAITYEQNCSCEFSSQCTSEGSFFEENSSQPIPIKGLKMGCAPSESFLGSTLACFYEQSCLSLLERYTNASLTTPLSKSTTQFATDTPVDKLLEHLFLEQWKTTLRYSSYFQQCAALTCSYTSLQQFHLADLLTILLGFHGGLTLVLKWICPKLVRVIDRIFQCRRKRRCAVHPIATLVVEDPRRDTVNVTSQ
jgi:hypothetical protein